MIEVEVRDIYPSERNDQKQILKAGLHVVVRVNGIEVSLRGVLVSKHRAQSFYRMPFKYGRCHLTGAPRTFPLFVFSDPELNKALLDGIRDKAPAAIEAFLKAHPQESMAVAKDVTPTADDQTKDRTVGAREGAITSDQHAPADKAAPKAANKLPEYRDLSPRMAAKARKFSWSR